MAYTKIICTLGPASSDSKTIARLIDAGANIFRINMSHGTHDKTMELINIIRDVSLQKELNIPVFMDLQGPKLRIGLIENGETELADGAELIITTDKIPQGSGSRISTDYTNIIKDVLPGDTILLDDGKIVLEALSISENNIKCRIKTGGVLKSRKGLMLPGKEIKLPALSDKDIDDVKFGMEAGIDGFMLSFVQKAEDISELHGIMRSCGKILPVVSKIESSKGIENLESIAKSSDALLVARGDLGVELPVWELPPMQNFIIKAALKERKPVIVATEMLESMIYNSRPTRAEVSDVAAAVTGGASAVMLSGETAVGKYPDKAVLIMDKTLQQAEKYMETSSRTVDPDSQHLIAESVSHSAVQLSRELNAKAILIYTEQGFTARIVSHFSPDVPVYAFSSDPHIARICNLFRGISPFILPQEARNFDCFIEQGIKTLMEKNLLMKGDTVVAVNVTGRNQNYEHSNSVRVFNC